MACPPIRIQIRGNLDDAFERARQKAEESGATLRGNTQRGSFSGMGVSGSYIVSGQTVTVTITSKPPLVPCSMIESELRKFFS